MIINWGDAPFKAYITVTYPSGTCTCTLGSESYSHSGGGTVTFTVKHKGTWTVKAVNGSFSTSKSAAISSLKETVTVTLTYTLNLFKAGTGIASGYSLKKTGYLSTSTTTSKITVTATSTEALDGQIYFSPAINCSVFKTMKVTAKWTGFHDMYTYVSVRLISSTTQDSDSNSLFHLGSFDSSKTYTEDLSSISGNKYLNFYSSRDGSFEITSIVFSS